MGLSLSSNLIKVVLFIFWQHNVMLKAASHRLASQWEATLQFILWKLLIEAQANLNVVVIHFTNPGAPVECAITTQQIQLVLYYN